MSKRETIAAFLQDLIKENFPTLDVGKVSNMYDNVIRPLSVALESGYTDIDKIKDGFSLNSESALLSEDEKSSFVDKVLSNLFLVRSAGGYARGDIRVMVSRSMDYIVPVSAIFTSSIGLTFVLDSTIDYVVSSSQLLPVYDSIGTIVSYYFEFPARGSERGELYNISSGSFKSYTRFSAYIQQVTSENGFTGGSDTETDDEFISRIDSAYLSSVPYSKYSIKYILNSNFPELVSRIGVFGCRDDEMRRDLAFREVEGLYIHTGGHTDVHVKSELKKVVERQVVGEATSVDMQRVFVFKMPVEVTPDPAITYQLYLHLFNCFGREHIFYAVDHINGEYVYVKDNQEFDYDTMYTGETIKWCLGYFNNADINLAFSDLYIASLYDSALWGYTTRQLQEDDHAFLSQNVVDNIEDVVMYDSDNIGTTMTRVYTTPSADDEYKLNHYADYSVNSKRDCVSLQFNTGLNGQSVEATYWTSSTLDTYISFMDNYSGKVASVDLLVRNTYCAFLEMDINYTTDALNPISEISVRNSVIDYINKYAIGTELSSSHIMNYIKQTYSDIKSIYPFSIYYNLELPNGKLARFVTSDKLIIPTTATEFVEYLDEGSTLTELDFNLVKYGITYNNVGYYTTESLVRVTGQLV